MTIEGQSSRLDNIQALRALAAMMVVILHSYGLGMNAGHDLAFLAGADPWGNAGVDLFFVISGFIMVHIYTARPHSPGRFLANRVARIVPLYWLVIGLFALAISRGAMAPVEAGPGQPWTSFLFVSQPVSGSVPLLFVGWTLEYEMFFYLCFAMAIAVAERTRIDLILALSGLVGGSILLLGVGSIALEFLFGALLARLLPLCKLTAKGGAALTLGGAVLLALGYGQPAAYEHRVLCFGIPAAMIVAGAVVLPQRAGKVAVLLGDASYSLYLIHLFVLAAIFAIVPAESGWMAVLLALMAAQFYAVALHRLVERPLTTLVRWSFHRLARSRPVVTLAA